MKTKVNGIFTLLLAFVVHLTFAQEKTISGTVTDQQGVPLPGVNILVSGTSNGTQSDFDGNYTIKGSEGQTLIFTYVGQKEISKIIGATSSINVTMVEDAQALDEIVVTALGISREKKSLGYSTQEVKGEELTTVKSGNFVNALSGKASGIQIKKNNNFGGSTNVVIRGNSSLQGNNQALFVIDGVPISNFNSNDANQGEGSGGYYDYGNAASDINPEDIASVNILKGAAASALYGSRAANGVIMITTKKGKTTNGIGVTVSSGVTFGTVDKSTFAKYQDQYGAGYGPGGDVIGTDIDGEDIFWEDQPGAVTPRDSYFINRDLNGDGQYTDLFVNHGDDASYGGRFDPNLLVYQWDSFDPASPNYQTATPWINAKNGPITFFETPVTTTNSVSLEKGFEDGSLRLNYTLFDQSGLLPNSSIKKHNISMSGTAKLNDKFTVSGYSNYIKTSGLGRNSTGYGDNIVGMFKQWWQTNVDIQDLQDIYKSTGRNVTWNPSTTDAGAAPAYWDNPYWTRFENYQNDSRSRFIGNISLNYQFNDWLSGMARIATDTYSELQEERRANGSVASSFGVSRGNVDSGYGRKNINRTETNYDFMLNFNKNLSEKFNLTGILGTNIRRTNFNSVYSSTSGGLSVPKLYSLQNSVGPLPLPEETAEKVGVDGIFASASLGYNNMLYVDATIRRDHSSTLPTENSSYYYPSVATSFVFNRLLGIDAISFGKLRVNYAEVGNDASFDYLQDSFVINTPIGTSSTSVSNTKKKIDLKPERTQSFEAGIEMRFVNNRLGFDVAYYKTNSVDQIFGVPVSTSTGFSNKILNAGEIENSGVEVSLTAMPVKTDNFNWNVNVNWTRNRNKVISLEDGIQNLQLGDFQGGVTINATVGQPYGVIQGTDYTYLNGERVVDEENGQYISTSNSNEVIGDSNPDWQMGITNSFNYKNLAFNFLIDIQQGGSIFSLDQYYGRATGLYEETAFINDLGNPVRNSLADGGGFINEGVNANGEANTTRINAENFGALGYRRGLPNSAFVYDASYVKLREASITYTFPKKIIERTFLTNATFSVVGSNLWIIHKNIPHEDPEGGLSSGNVQGYSVSPLPTTRDLGFNIKLQF
ncbi:SusC/RagA family TonB-linked outer membrane protein [Cellulophaga baltica]|uniref:Membrane protein n=1 Tax=Cellulophaga baltica 18 TaxID=1348584 RepID=A0AAU8RRF0_9FLAO|nr:SusC/RagA family TonB-linked outer membrane protein [Cellulophaga baltica]AIZ40290.1 membrane protein [Cellulophaga baltica 18]